MNNSQSCFFVGVLTEIPKRFWIFYTHNYLSGGLKDIIGNNFQLNVGLADGGSNQLALRLLSYFPSPQAFHLRCLSLQNRQKKF